MCQMGQTRKRVEMGKGESRVSTVPEDEAEVFLLEISTAVIFRHRAEGPEGKGASGE